MKPNVVVPGRPAAAAPQTRGRDGRFSIAEETKLDERVEKVEALAEIIRVELNNLRRAPGRMRRALVDEVDRLGGAELGAEVE
jgi:hypothetical protein